MGSSRRQRKTEPCKACSGRGWLLMHNVDRHVVEIQRCDTCERFRSDERAGEHAAPILDQAMAVRDGIIFQEAQATAGQRRRKGRR
jgi:hypothetical protein